MTVLELDLPPTANHLFAGNGKRRYRTPQYNAWIEAAGWQLAAQYPRKWQGPVSIALEVREPPTARREDLASREKASLDLLVRHGVIQDDSQAYVRQITLGWAQDITGVRITIKPWIE